MNEVVCHGDASPCNCVFRDGVPYAFIDFDAAHSGDRREDVGYAAWLWLDIGNDDLDPVQQGHRLGEFVVTYGATNFTDAILAVIDAQTELSERDETSASTQEWSRQCLRWTNDNREALEVGLALARQSAF
jgi:aminoglycoside phosphotransferase (APT) family kinase protein